MVVVIRVICGFESLGEYTTPNKIWIRLENLTRNTQTLKYESCVEACSSGTDNANWKHSSDLGS
jgi:hypothetical protein